MVIRIGDLVLVNAAAFTASRWRSREAIPCEVLEVLPDRLLVSTRFPYRVFSTWVSDDWIEGAERAAESAAR